MRPSNDHNRTHRSVLPGKDADAAITANGDIIVRATPNLRPGSLYPTLLELRRRTNHAVHAVHAVHASLRSRRLLTDVDGLAAAPGGEPRISTTQALRIWAKLDTARDVPRTHPEALQLF
ncbi:hypothetical protein LQL77_31580 [Rhodococcus cerastii]|nr:hypothetical protein [Rhodococcus cerastii]